jgi:hypothetical protein
MLPPQLWDRVVAAILDLTAERRVEFPSPALYPLNA